MNFKEMIHNDIDNIFLNINEFAETVLIQGVEIKAIIQAVSNSVFNNLNETNQYGLAKSYIKVYYKKDEFDFNFFVGQNVAVNQGSYFIEDIQTNEKLEVLTLSVVGTR